MACSHKDYFIAVIRALLEEISTYPLSQRGQHIRILSHCSHELYNICAYWREEKKRIRAEVAELRSESVSYKDDDLPF